MNFKPFDNSFNKYNRFLTGLDATRRVWRNSSLTGFSEITFSWYQSTREKKPSRMVEENLDCNPSLVVFWGVLKTPSIPFSAYNSDSLTHHLALGQGPRPWLGRGDPNGGLPVPASSLHKPFNAASRIK